MYLKKQELVNMWEELSQDYTEEFKKAILVPTGRGDRYAARDYIYANCILSELTKATKYLPEDTEPFNPKALKERSDIKQWLHPTTLYRLSGYTPCLAHRYDELKPEAQKALFDSKRIIMTKKENGVRLWIINAGGKTTAFSRNYSNKDCSLPEYWDNILQDYTGSERTWAVDVECKWEPGVDLTEILGDYGVSTDSKLEAMASLLQMNTPQALEIQEEFKRRFGRDLVTFRLITPLYWKGKNYKNRSLGEGFLIEDEVIEHLQNNGINIQKLQKVVGTREEKEVQLNAWIDEGEEGVIFHFLDSKYHTGENRKKDVFVKLKRTVGDAAKKAGLGDTIDGWVTGFKLGTPGTANEGLVSALEVTVNLVRADGSSYEHPIAWVPNIELELKKTITTLDFEGNPTLDPSFYGTVLEVEGQAISAVSKRLTHPRLITLRFDKNASDCNYSESFINSQIDSAL